MRIGRDVAVTTLVIAIVGACACSAQLQPALATVGFGVSVPYRLPVDWGSSFSYVSIEVLLSRHLTVHADLGAYPASFPDLFEGSAALLVKGWIGPTALYAGGGLSLQCRRVGSAWSLKPFLNLRAGYQIWLIDSFAIVLQFRSLDPLPIEWTLSPEIALGVAVGLGSARPETPRYEGDYLWLLVGLGVAALLAYLPRE